MIAIILAAGVGARLAGATPGPKCLLELGGRTLLGRHLDNLARLGVDGVSICVGYEAERVRGAVSAHARPPVLLCHNPLYRLGSIVSLWTARAALAAGADVLVMDADVLYHPAILERLVASRHADCCLMDRDFAAGDEPVKICLEDDRIVEFRKRLDPGLAYNRIGESVGFFKLTPATALRLATLAGRYVADGRRELPHEEALRELALAADAAFGVEDVTGLPWIEIDFPEDVERARFEVLPAVDAR
jgi:choline kinase